MRRISWDRVFEIPEHQSVAANAQVAMLAAFLDALAIGKVDIVASDSGGAVAQLFVVRHPKRVRSLLLTNCDVEPDSPPPKVRPMIEMARAGTLAEATAKWLTDKALARSTFGAAVYRDPSRFADETIEYYVTPLVSTPLPGALPFLPHRAGSQSARGHRSVAQALHGAGANRLGRQRRHLCAGRCRVSRPHIAAFTGYSARAGSEAVLPGRVPGSDCRRSAPTVERVIIAVSRVSCVYARRQRPSSFVQTCAMRRRVVMLALQCPAQMH